MNNCNVNKFINTRYKRLMTCTDIDLIQHKKKYNHIRIIESKYPTEKDKSSQDDVLKEIARIFKFAIDRGYKNIMGTPTLEVLKLVCEPRKLDEVQHEKIPNQLQEVYDIPAMKTIDYLDGSEKIYQTKQDIDDFFLMEKNVYPKYNDYYDIYYRKEKSLTLF